MAAMNFDDELEIDGSEVLAKGPLKLDPGEKLMVICVKIHQPDTYAGYGNSPATPHGSTSKNPADKGDTWELDVYPESGRATPGPAVASGSAITDTPGGMNAYSWVQPVLLVTGP